MDSSQINRLNTFLKEVLICPKSGESLILDEQHNYLKTLSGENRYVIKEGIPIFLDWEEKTSKLSSQTKLVQDFYEETPFPNYDTFDDLASLIDKSKQSIFARLLDDQIPFGTRVLECGCGTGQLSNFLAIAHRDVLGIDLSWNSLKLAQAFKLKNQLKRVHFVQMNLWQAALKPQSFDIIIANGVLHHTPNTQEALAKLVKLLKPQGYIIIGLYHHYARLYTDWQGFFYRTRQKLRPSSQVSAQTAKERAWQRDQYQNPLESKHTLREVLKWFEKMELQFISSIPKPNLSESFGENDQLFSPDQVGSSWELILKELGMTWTHAQEGGFFVMIARKIK